MGLQISLGQNDKEKNRNRRKHIWHGPSATIKILGSASGPSSLSTWALLSMSDTICWRVSIDCLVLLLVVGPYIWEVLGFSSLVVLSFCFIFLESHWINVMFNFLLLHIHNKIWKPSSLTIPQKVMTVLSFVSSYITGLFFSLCSMLSSSFIFPSLHSANFILFVVFFFY